ncbi:hypothetical protein [Halorubrum sp. CSM-61]|uniref:hypothetical protein n=1 Tax=Halorubrum sp. CSM-61 TaxID=2485838 RepID=UPI000F4B380E|nr:hypothetical protein [Halorubrum sp. CSM-61]
MAFLVAGGALALLRAAGAAGTGPGLGGIAVAHPLFAGNMIGTVIRHGGSEMLRKSGPGSESGPALGSTAEASEPSDASER